VEIEISIINKRSVPLSETEQQLLQTLGKKYDKERQEELVALERLRQKQLRGEPLSEAEQQLL